MGLSVAELRRFAKPERGETKTEIEHQGSGWRQVHGDQRERERERQRERERDFEG